MHKRGLIQIYTGDGKGKTTAALGLALRAAGWGKKVLIYQFLKPPSLELGERRALQGACSGIVIEAFQTDWDMRKSCSDATAVTQARAVIRDVLAKIARDASKKVYDVIILDEIVLCISKALARLEDIKNIIDNRAPEVEIILTGRGATGELTQLADLVTEVKSVKHPFNDGVKARKGIDF